MNMKMTKELLAQMFEEEHDFYTYLDYAEEITDDKVKMTLKNIAAQEREHYKMLYDILFSDEKMRDADEFKQAVRDHAKCQYLKMEEVDHKK